MKSIEKRIECPTCKRKKLKLISFIRVFNQHQREFKCAHEKCGAIFIS